MNREDFEELQQRFGSPAMHRTLVGLTAWASAVAALVFSPRTLVFATTLAIGAVITSSSFVFRELRGIGALNALLLRVATPILWLRFVAWTWGVPDEADSPRERTASRIAATGLAACAVLLPLSLWIHP